MITFRSGAPSRAYTLNTVLSGGRFTDRRVKPPPSRTAVTFKGCDRKDLLCNGVEPRRHGNSLIAAAAVGALYVSLIRMVVLLCGSVLIATGNSPPGFMSAVCDLARSTGARMDVVGAGALAGRAWLFNDVESQGLQ
jgi:hypothetical protein